MKNTEKLFFQSNEKSKSTLKHWKTMERRDLIEDLPWLKLSVECVLLPNGQKIKNFYQVHLPEYAVIVAQTLEGLVIIEQQYKHAAGKVILNLPAGYLNSNELPLACAQRELLEETGFKGESWYHLGTFCVDGNRGCGKMHAFVAVGAYRVSEPNNEATEELDIIFKKPDETLRLLLDGEIVTLGSALALSLAFLSPSSPLVKNEILKLKED